MVGTRTCVGSNKAARTIVEKNMKGLIALLLCFAMSSCVSLRIGPDSDFLEMKGLANVYGTFDGLDSWDGHTWFDFGLFTNTDGRSELASLELGPLAAVGVGLLGARVRVLGLEIGLGTLFYNPRRRSKQEPVAEPVQLDEEAVQEDGGDDVDGKKSA